MKQKELISVIIPVYNIANYFTRCFETIVRQTYDNLEIILVDDGSTDASGSMCDDFAASDSRVKVIHQENAGLGEARNSGKRASTGNYIMFVDGDDYLHVEAIQVLYDAINSGPYDIAQIERKKTERADEDIYKQAVNPVQVSLLSGDQMLANMINHPVDKTLFVLVWNKLYRRRLIDDFWFKYRTTQDFDFNFRVYLQLKKAIWVHRSLYFYVQRPGSICHSVDAWTKYYKNRTEMLFNNYQMIPDRMDNIKHVVLTDLYEFMIALIHDRWNTSERQTTCALCRNYERITRPDLWYNKRIHWKTKLQWTLRIMLTNFSICI